MNIINNMSAESKIPLCTDRKLGIVYLFYSHQTFMVHSHLFTSYCTGSRRPLYLLHFESAVGEYDAACATHLAKHIPQLAHFTKNRPINHIQFVEFVKMDRKFWPSIPQYSPRPKPKAKRKRKKKQKYKRGVPYTHVKEIVESDRIFCGYPCTYSPGKAPWHMPEKIHRRKS